MIAHLPLDCRPVKTSALLLRHHLHPQWYIIPKGDSLNSQWDPLHSRQYSTLMLERQEQQI